MEVDLFAFARVSLAGSGSGSGTIDCHNDRRAWEAWYL